MISYGRLHVLISLTLVAGFLAACGGGGNSPTGVIPPLSPPSPDSFETAEYEAQVGLGLVNASSIYARGGRGQGVTVAVFDSGATPDHPDLGGKYVSMENMPGANPMDMVGHGTHVGGIIAARKSNAGMHGVAYDARLASYTLNFGLARINFDNALSTSVDNMRTRGILVTNNSWEWRTTGADEARRILEVTRQGIEIVFLKSIPAYVKYVEAGGVQVWAAGNAGRSSDNALDQVSWNAGMPHLVPELKDGWLAVVAVGNGGQAASYTQPCGVAAEWCLAAPGGDLDRDDGILSTVPAVRDTDGDGYGRTNGTSMAAPHVSGALAALKSLFPSLSYHDLRNRILATADSSGIYADTELYGQGLLDLDAASRPVGGTGFALGASNADAVVTTDGALLTLPAAAISRYLDGWDILVLDNYQRAPFLVPAGAFAEEGGAYLSMDDLDLARPERRWREQEKGLALTVSGDDFRAQGVSNGSWFAGRAEGAGVMEGMAHLVGVPLPHGDYRMADDAQGVTLGLTSEEGEFYASAAMNGEAGRTGAAGFGIAGWNPESVVTASFVPDTGTAEVFGMSVASALERPMGWGGSGALALSGDSIELAYRRDIVSGESYRLGAGARLAHLATEASPLVDFDDAVVASAGLDLLLRLGASMTLGARLGVERPVRSGDGSIRVASSIDENGRIGYDDILIDGSDFLSFDRADLGIGYAHGRSLDIRAGVAAVRDGFGETEAIAGAQAELRF